MQARNSVQGGGNRDVNLNHGVCVPVLPPVGFHIYQFIYSLEFRIQLGVLAVAC